MSEVNPTIQAHSCHESGTVRKTSPPSSTMSHCPSAMSASTVRNVRLCAMPWLAAHPASNPLALNRFQNCRKTKVVKNTVSWRTVGSPVV